MYKISLEDATPGMTLDADLYAKAHSNSFALLTKGSVVTANFLYLLKKRGVTHLYTENPAAFDDENSDYKIMNKRNPLALMSIPAEKSKSVITPKTKKEVLKTMKNFHISLSGMDEDDVCKTVNELDINLQKMVKEFPDNLSEHVNVHQLRHANEKERHR